MASSASQSQNNISPKTSFVSRGRRDMALLLFALLVLFLVLLWFTFSSVREYLNIQEVIVSDYRGMDYNQAERELRNLGLDVNFYPKAVSNQALNTVVAQSLEPNTMIRKGRVVNLGVHLPEESFNVPNLVGLDETEAMRLLDYSKLNVGEVRYTFSELAEGAVVSSSPPAQELLESGANVDLVISRGLAASKIEMPQLVNLPLEEAVKRLKAVGINRIETVVAEANYRRVGQVVNQHPQAGRVTMPSAPVVLYYAMNDPNVVSVPNVTGMSVQQAYEALSGAGLELTGPWISIVNDPNLPQGVIEQQPTGFSIRGTPSYLVVNGAEGTLVTPSIDLTAPGSVAIGPDGLPRASALGLSGQLVDAFGNPVNPASNQAATAATNGPRPVPLPNFIRPVSQFPTLQADGSIVPNPNRQNPVPFTNTGQPLPNQQLQRNLGNTGLQNPNFPAQTTLQQQQLLQQQPQQVLTPQQELQQQQTANIRNLTSPQANIQPNLQSNPNVTTGNPNPIPTQQQAATSTAPRATVPRVVEPATDTSVRNIPISFNPQNYGFIQSSQNEYRLIVIDAQGERELIRRNLAGDDVINTMITMYGRGEIQTYVNGSLFQAWSP